MDEKKMDAEELGELIKEINKTIESIAESLKTMAGSVDKADGIMCVKGDMVTTCYREY